MSAAAALKSNAGACDDPPATAVAAGAAGASTKAIVAAGSSPAATQARAAASTSEGTPLRDRYSSTAWAGFFAMSGLRRKPQAARNCFRLLPSCAADVFAAAGAAAVSFLRRSATILSTWPLSLASSRAPSRDRRSKDPPQPAATQPMAPSPRPMGWRRAGCVRAILRHDRQAPWRRLPQLATTRSPRGDMQMAQGETVASRSKAPLAASTTPAMLVWSRAANWQDGQPRWFNKNGTVITVHLQPEQSMEIVTS